MHYYILASTKPGAASNDYILMVVKPAEVAAFLAEHGPRILAQGTSIAEALQQFLQLPDRA